jgi:hypothetical protein
LYKLVETYRGVAYPWQCDAMGHMNTQFYSALYDGAGFHFLAMLAQCRAGAGGPRLGRCAPAHRIQA